ncbi:MAG: hypothetical protein V7K72_13190 [Nostoc sp.]|uniref:hypothetical protein n=1 Tax=Nostoc sp. TaxID=1180 RepID=UPI002FF4F178
MFDLVAGSGFEPLTFGLCLPTTTLVAQLYWFVVWTVPSPSSLSLGCLPSSLYTFLISEAWFGITALLASPSLTDKRT